MNGRRKMSREHDVIARYEARKLGSDFFILMLTLTVLLVTLVAR